MGSMKKPAEIAEKAKFHIRCLPVDKTNWEKAARHESLTTSAWVRRVCNAEARRILKASS